MNATYLDWNATARVRPEAVDAVGRALQVGGNPSSVHAAGRAARAMLEAARAEVAALVAVKPGSVTFTSGGTEATVLAIESAMAAGCARIIVGATEHDAVRENARATGAPIEVWPVDRDGRADLGWLERALASGPRALVCLMSANNETGVIQPVAEASALVRAAGGWLHVDAIQSAGKVRLDFNALGADTMALSGHKVGGPLGVGALVAGTRATVSRRQHGGGQEHGRRAGAENLPGIAGFGAAATAALADFDAIERQAPWRDALQARLAPHAEALGAAAPRLPQTLSVASPGWGSEVQVMNLDLAGVMVSTGAACSSGKVRPSHVVEAMGRPDLAPFVLRISGGWATTEADWVRCGDVWLEAHARYAARRREFA